MLNNIFFGKFDEKFNEITTNVDSFYHVIKMK